MTDSKSHTESVDVGQYWQYLRDVPAPGTSRDIVEEGLVHSLDRDEKGVLSVTIDEHVCPNEDVFLQLVPAIREALEDETGDSRVRVMKGGEDDADEPPSGNGADSEGPEGRPMTPLQAELMEEGRVPEPDPIGQSTTPPNAAPGAGYSDKEGPDPLDGPGGIDQEDAMKAEYGGETAVFQWEIDPHDPEADTGEAHVEEDDWEFRIWWQHHPEGLAYASLRAIADDDQDRGGDARPHAVGRAIVVNLVYDREREGVIAVYGTTRDFRPFIEAFERAHPDISEEDDENDE